MARKLFSQRQTPNAIQQVEELAKLKRPISSMMAAETGSSIPFIVPGTSFKSMDAPKQQPKEEVVPELTDYSQLLPQDEQQQQGGELNYTQQALLEIYNQYMQSVLSQAVASSKDGGYIMPDQSIQYPDGTVRPAGSDANAYGVASVPGGTKYSDGSIRQYANPGLQNLIRGIMGGRDAFITQEYGNYNPGMGYAGNIHGGTDVRTRDLPEGFEFTNPVENGEIVEIVRAESGSPWGNSIVIRSPDGYSVRLSHMSSMRDYNIGDKLTKDAPIGEPGSTGNSTAEHLDIRLYDQSMTEINPSEWPGELQKMANSAQEFKQTQSQPGQVLGTQTQQALAIQPTQPSRMNQVIDKAATQFGSVAGKGIEALNPTGRFDLGVSETLQGNKPAAQEAQRQTIEGIGTLTKAPEMYTGELSKMQGTDPFRQALGNVTDYMGNKLKQLGINTEDLGLKNVSEYIAGGKTTFSQGVQDVLSPIMKSIPTSQAYAADTSTIPQSGAGIDAMKGSVLGATTRPTPADISPRLAIGDITGPTAGASAQLSRPVASTAQMEQAGPQADIRDPFFKQGLDKAYASLIDPEKAKSGALTMDLFSPEVFQDENAIKSIFGGTNLESQANQKYQQYLDSLKPPATLQEYLDRGQTVEQWFAETGQQSSLDQLRQSGASLDQIKQSYESSTPNIFPSMNISSEKPNQKSISNFNKTADYSKLSSVKMPEPVKGYSYDMPVQKSSSAQITTKPSGGGVSNIFSAIARLFKR